MAKLEDIEPVLAACLLNAERLLDSAKAVMAPGRYHVAYHLAALALEEIGKTTLILAIITLTRPVIGCMIGVGNLSICPMTVCPIPFDLGDGCF